MSDPELISHLKELGKKKVHIILSNADSSTKKGGKTKKIVDGTNQEARAELHEAELDVADRILGVLVLTYLDPARVEATKAHLAAWRIPFDELVIAPSLEAKGELCGALGVDLFFDDQDECIATVPENVLVCKVRNGGNFDFVRQRWLSTSRLTELIR